MKLIIKDNIKRDISIEEKLKDFDIEDDINELSKIFEEIYKEKIDKSNNDNRNTLWWT